MKQCLLVLLFCCAATIFAKDYVITSAGGDVAAAALDSTEEIKSLNVKTSGLITKIQYWDQKKLKLNALTAKISKVSGGYEITLKSPVKSSAIVLRGKMLKLKNISFMEVVTAAGKRKLIIDLSGKKGKILRPDQKKAMATVLPGLVLFPGKQKSKQLTLASPNRLNRKDRGVINLDLTDYIGKDKVSFAALTLTLVPRYATYPRMVNVELLDLGQEKITVDAGFGHSAKTTAQLMLPFGPRLGAFTVTLDITPEVNAALNKGENILTWRFIDMHCLQLGNLRKRAYAITVPAKSIFFTIAE